MFLELFEERIQLLHELFVSGGAVKEMPISVWFGEEDTHSGQVMVASGFIFYIRDCYSF